MRLQSLLTEGRFVASYKFALLLALCDLCVEMDAPDERELRVPLNSIAEKFIIYYWRKQHSKEQRYFVPSVEVQRENHSCPPQKPSTAQATRCSNQYS